MSKTTIRIVFALLISLVIVAGIFTSVQGAALNAGARGGGQVVDAGLMPILSRPRSSGAAEILQTYAPKTASPARSGHNCDGALPDD
jgi:hypothetical protein